MGVYWKPVNVTLREYLHPHRLGDGLKRAEWVPHPDSATNLRIAALFESGEWSRADDIRAVSDAGSEEQLFGERTEVCVFYDELDEDEGELKDRSRR